MIYLPELANIANPLTLQRAEVVGNSATLEVHQSGERLIKQGSDRGNGEVTGFGL